MLSIIAAYPLAFILAPLIGLATAWWVWGTSAAVADEVEEEESYEAEAEEASEPVAEPEPEPEPEIVEVTEPEAKKAPAAPVIAAAAASATVAPKAKAKPPKPLTVAEIENKPNIAAAVGDPDDLKRVKGIGPKLEDLCNSLGVTRFDQIAAWRVKDIKEVDAHLGNFTGRITRDEWVAQAKLLAAGRVTEHAKRFGA